MSIVGLDFRMGAGLPPKYGVFRRWRVGQGGPIINLQGKDGRVVAAAAGTGIDPHRNAAPICRAPGVGLMPCTLQLASA